MGVAPLSWKKTVYDIWESKQPGPIVMTPPTPWQQRGLDLEPEALRIFEAETGYLMSPNCLVNPRRTFMMSSLDGFDIDGKAGVEIKVPNISDHECAIAGELPKTYIPQVQHHIEVTGLEKFYYMSYKPEHEKKWVILEIYSDQDYIDKLIEVERKFYEDHMLTGIPPQKIESIKTIESHRWSNLSFEYLKIDHEIKELEKYRESLKENLIDEAQKENAKGNGIILQKIERKGIINYQNIPMLKTMDLEEFRKPSTSFWQLKEVYE